MKKNLSTVFKLFIGVSVVIILQFFVELDSLTFQIKDLQNDADINIIASLTVLYAFSTKEDDPLDNYIFLSIAKKFIRIGLGTFFTLVLFAQLLHLGVLIDAVSLKLTNFVIVDWILYLFFKVETMLCNTTLVFKDCITDIFDDKLEGFLILSFDIMILVGLMCIILNCFFKKPFSKFYNILKRYFYDKS